MEQRVGSGSSLPSHLNGISMPVDQVMASRDLRVRLQDVFESVFTRPEELKRMVRLELNKHIESLVTPGRLPDVISQLLFDQSIDPGWLPALVQAACRFCPRSTELRSLADDLGWAPVPVQIARGQRNSRSPSAR